MSIPFHNLLEKFGVPAAAEELVTLNAPFDWANTANAILELENKIDGLEITKKAKKYIAKIVTESLDNVCRHASLNIESTPISSFSSYLADAKLFVLTRNLIPTSIENQLVSTIESLNLSSKEDLNEQFRYRLKHGKLSDEGNAGLGLLEIARKTTDKIKFDFEKNDNSTSFFTLFVTVNSKEI